MVLGSNPSGPTSPKTIKCYQAIVISMNLGDGTRDGKFLESFPYLKLEVMRRLDEDTLVRLGLKKWHGTDENEIWLFPVEWYENIPERFEIITIFERVKEFDRSEDLKEERGGVMPFGISRSGGLTKNTDPSARNLEQWRKYESER